MAFGDERLPMPEILLLFAELLADRSTCSRLAVGAVVTDEHMLQILGIGYNGNAARLPNKCDDPEKQGGCGCLHAEINALLKAPGVLPNKKLFITDSPCIACAKAAINAQVTDVYFRRRYRLPAGITTLEQAGVRVHHLPGWRVRLEQTFD